MAIVPTDWSSPARSGIVAPCPTSKRRTQTPQRFPSANSRARSSARSRIDFGFVRVRGEISGYRGPHSSGHVYFSLKDAGARLDAVIWKGVFSRMRIKPEDGLEVDRHRQDHDVREQVFVPDRRRIDRAGRRRRADGAAGGPSPQARLGRAVRPCSQTIAALHAPGHRGRDLADRRGDSRYPSPIVRSISGPCARMARAGAGRNGGRGGGARDRGFQRLRGRTARYQDQTFSSSPEAAARSRISGASMKRMSSARRRKAGYR